MATYVTPEGRPILVGYVPDSGTGANGPPPPCVLVPLTTTPTSGVAPYLILEPHPVHKENHK